MNNNKLKPQELLILTIDLGDKRDEIHVKPTDTPLCLAKQFCKKHNLNSEVEASVSQYLLTTLSNLVSSPQKNKAKTPQSPWKNEPDIIPRVKRIARGGSNHAPNRSLSKKELGKGEGKNFRRETLPGERLYYKAVDDLRNKNQLIEKLIAEREANELSGFTFRPRINPRSRIGMRNTPQKEICIQDKIEFRKIKGPSEEVQKISLRNLLNRNMETHGSRLDE